MRSPFPGMDPYLERYWANVHGAMIGAIAAALNESLPSGLAARSEQQVRVEALAGDLLHGYRPDVAVVRSPASRARETGLAAGGVAVRVEPVRIEYLEATIVDRHVRVIDLTDGKRVVTAIEVLSPWNKLAGKLNRIYRKKQRAFEHGGTNWVELDLLRSSRDRLAVPWESIRDRGDASYLMLAYEAEEGELSGWPVGLRSRLPVISVPLRPGEAPALLDVQAVVDRAYREQRLESIDYSEPPDPPLSPDDAAWAAELVKQRAAT